MKLLNLLLLLAHTPLLALLFNANICALKAASHTTRFLIFADPQMEGDSRIEEVISITIG